VPDAGHAESGECRICRARPSSHATSTSEAAKQRDWLDGTVRVTTLSSLTLEQWLRAFQDLKKKNAEIQKVGKTATRHVR
jgi:hypothetical protein